MYSVLNGEKTIESSEETQNNEYVFSNILLIDTDNQYYVEDHSKINTDSYKDYGENQSSSTIANAFKIDFTNITLPKVSNVTLTPIIESGNTENSSDEPTTQPTTGSPIEQSTETPIEEVQPIDASKDFSVEYFFGYDGTTTGYEEDVEKSRKALDKCKYFYPQLDAKYNGHFSSKGVTCESDYTTLYGEGGGRPTKLYERFKRNNCPGNDYEDTPDKKYKTEMYGRDPKGNNSCWSGDLTNYRQTDVGLQWDTHTTAENPTKTHSLPRKISPTLTSDNGKFIEVFGEYPGRPAWNVFNEYETWPQLLKYAQNGGNVDKKIGWMTGDETGKGTDSNGNEFLDGYFVYDWSTPHIITSMEFVQFGEIKIGPIYTRGTYKVEVYVKTTANSEWIKIISDENMLQKERWMSKATQKISARYMKVVIQGLKGTNVSYTGLQHIKVFGIKK